MHIDGEPDPKVDSAIIASGDIDDFLRQGVDDATPFAETVQTLVNIANRRIVDTKTAKIRGKVSPA